MSDSRDFSAPPRATTIPVSPAHIDLEAQVPKSPLSLTSPIRPTDSSSRESIDNMKRRPTRSNTAKTYGPQQHGRQWQPGQEPGIDTNADHDGHSSPHGPPLQQACEITVVDFSQDYMQMRHLDNKSLGPFMELPREDWVVSRWISVNGLSWDVIKLLGNDKGLHRLAIEDLMNTRNRTKADWYSDHTYSRPTMGCHPRTASYLMLYSCPTTAEADTSSH